MTLAVPEELGLVGWLSDVVLVYRVQVLTEGYDELRTVPTKNSIEPKKTLALIRTCSHILFHALFTS